ncbi:MAG TPA: tRNA (N6-isopentenyl adenosine(37)-C2)-methylthiotransferase MiaB, partial [Polyangiaceae bacterium]|nr:tRNA (N6-isopentenyl adenosine(37)-C2)-methylthiotransferase MiaB [Polyangiaceae bacterium]
SHDSERIGEVLRGAGHLEAASVEDADLVLLNTCSIREKAEQKLRSEVGRIALLKQKRPELTIAVAGCVAQQEGEGLLKRMPDVDLLLGPDNIPELPRLLAELDAGAVPFARASFDLDNPQFLTALSVQSGAATAFVTTMKGCDERCSFCIVPYTRGPERYRPAQSVVAEIAALAAAGVREVTLLGQTVNSYRDPDRSLAPAPDADTKDEDESEFAALVRRIASEVPALARLRYTSPHPRHLTPSLVRAHREIGILARHVHLPVQSGSDRMLKRMIRRYTRADYVARVARLRREVPGVTLSTDVIVGFPGETDDDFELTLSLVEEVGFVGVFGFKYSPRPYTPALKLGDDVPEETKSRRLSRLFERSEAILSSYLGSLEGTRQRVLIEGEARRGLDGAGRPTFTGRTENNAIVHVDDPAALGLVGEVVEVEIVRALRHSVVGKLDEAAAARGAERARAAGARPKPRRALPVVSEDA